MDIVIESEVLKLIDNIYVNVDVLTTNLTQTDLICDQFEKEDTKLDNRSCWLPEVGINRKPSTYSNIHKYRVTWVTAKPARRTVENLQRSFYYR